MPRWKKRDETADEALPSPNPGVATEGYRVYSAEKPPEKPAGFTITYLGDPNRNREGPENPTFAGKLMPKGEPVTITDAKWIEKFGFRFRRNRHFRVE